MFFLVSDLVAVEVAAFDVGRRHGAALTDLGMTADVYCGLLAL